MLFLYLQQTSPVEHFIVSARKYRPQTFKDVVGQEAITNTLTNAIENHHLAQALLFCGPRGVGKTTCARILAKQINQDGTEQKDEDFAFNIFELDAASNNSVDDIRNLTDQVRIPPQVGKYKVYIIDEVHMLSQAAFNAFLKTLEEPPKHAIFILATTEKHKIIPTILSRCQIFDFKRITVKDAAEYLKYIAKEQGVDAEDDALHIIAQKADGAMRDALSIFDRVVSFSGKQLTRKAVTENLNVLDYDTYFSATDLILQHNIPELLLLFNKTLSLGFDGHHFISGLASHFRDLMVCQHQATIALLEVGDTAKAHYLEQSKKTANPFLLKALDLANDCDLKYRTSKNQRLLVELTLMKLASIDFDGQKKNPESVASDDSGVNAIVPASYFKDRKGAHSDSKPASDIQASGSEVETDQKNVAIPVAHSPNPIAAPQKKNTDIASGKLVKDAAEALENDSRIRVNEARTKITGEQENDVEINVDGPERQRVDKKEHDIEVAVNTTETQVAESPLKTEIKKPDSQKKIQLDLASKRVSALSISSLKAKKEHQLSKKGEEIDESQLPNEAFTQEQMQKHWAEFVEKIDSDGQKILASSLTTDVPKMFDETTIWIELPNDTMKKEVEREQYDLMVYLKHQLKNHFISLRITVNEDTAKKYAFTPEEKYEKLREKNPAIDLLRQTFDLDL
ncbi:DNA polymerase-3 subunit gamma/tau [Pricia antarctica]|uniref:DNA polymerase III subunit gamma/tau n=1 Tax=Pricia antarctica TaxID=641691 RepID=A0A1G7FU80_9FLAO|nr:DNA polymerase-3 subunit gamma/tau [Pricia antarctica]